MSLIFASNGSKIQFEGEDISGVQELGWKIIRNRQNIHAISTEERIGTVMGAYYVEGTLKIKSSYDKLDKKLYEKFTEIKSFQIVVDLYSQGSDQSVRKITFDECYVDAKSFGMDVNGVALTIYNFTATRVREE